MDATQDRLGTQQAEPWLVLRTRCHHEDVVHDALRQRDVMAYLPKQRTTRCWRGHRRTVETPLFPGYLFVRPRLNQYEAMHYIRGSCGLVLGGGKKPAPLPERDLQAVRALVDSGAAVTVDSELVAGRRVRVLAGPLMGVEGELARVKQRDVLVINVDLVSSSVRVELGREAVELI